MWFGHYPDCWDPGTFLASGSGRNVRFFESFRASRPSSVSGSFADDSTPADLQFPIILRLESTYFYLKPEGMIPDSDAGSHSRYVHHIPTPSYHADSPFFCW